MPNVSALISLAITMIAAALLITERLRPDLIALLNDEDRLLARLAADALIAIGGQAVGGLVEAMRTGAPSARLEAVRALARIGDPRAIPALFETLGGDSALLEHWASRGLERMGVGMLFFKPGG